ncbi:MAG: hypothetical protein WCD37_20595 [Chloroflexia bacterium]
MHTTGLRGRAGVWARLEIVQQAVSTREHAALGNANHVGVAESVLRALAYSDLFDYPLSLGELARYQIETLYSSLDIEAALATDPGLRAGVTRSEDGFYCLQGREQVFATRQARAVASARVWRRARRYGAIISRFPFVRMVAVTGALAVDNIAARPDIDLLVVTVAGRVWVARRVIVALVRLARLFGDDLCPNYIISEKALSLDQRDLFTAHELAQMVPLCGPKTYRDMLRQNDWAESYLPSAFKLTAQDLHSGKPGPVRRMVERVLGLSIFDRWEGWELSRLRQKLRPLVGDDAEVVCSPYQCKGHTGLHRQWVTARYEERLRELGLL